MKPRWVVIFALFLLGAFGSIFGLQPQSVPSGDSQGQLLFEGRTRNYVLHLPPAYNGRDPLPLVLFLHGGGGNAQGATSAYGLSALAEKPAGKLYVVEMYDFYFDPPGLFIQPGDRVAWIMLEDHLADGHSATAYHPDYDKELRIPEGAAAWNSGLLKQIGDSYEYTFDAIGVHDYFCIPHEDSGMVGRIVVKEATGPGTKPLSQGISAAGQSVMPTLQELTGPVGQIFNLQGRINAVVFKIRQNARNEALQLLDDLMGDLWSGEGKEGSLFEVLTKIGQWEAALRGLQQLRESIASNQTLRSIQEISQSLKALLDEVVQELSKA